MRLVAHGGWGHNARFIANRPTLDLLRAYSSSLSAPLGANAFISTSDAFDDAMEHFFQTPWWPTGAQAWRDTLLGTGTFSYAVDTELERVRRDVFAFDAVVIWGLNGGVRAFCDRNKLVCVHGEMGATRSPLPQCFYFDPFGSHGFALMPSVAIDDLPVAAQGYDGAALLHRAKSRAIDGSKLRALVPLQLCDDANMLAVPTGPVDIVETLRETVPRLLDAGYEVTVKCHPGALNRYNSDAQTACRQFVESLPGAQMMDGAPPPDYLQWLADFCLVVSMSSSMAFEASLAGCRVVLQLPASFAAKGAFPSLEQALHPDCDWPLHLERSRRNAQFYLSAYAALAPENAGPLLLETIKFHQGWINETPSKAYADAWLRVLGPMRAAMTRRAFDAWAGQGAGS